MSITDSNEIKEELDQVLTELHETIEHQRALRKRAIKLANIRMSYTGRKYIGAPNKIYIGPDVDNKNTIILIGPSANSAIQQMETLGKRVSLRQPRVNKGKANRAIFKDLL